MLRNQKYSFSSLELIFFKEIVSIFSKTFVERFSHRIILIPRLNEAMIKRELQDLFRSERWEMFSGKLKSSRNYYISLAVQVCGDTNKNRRVWSAETNYPNLPRGNSCSHQRSSLSVRVKYAFKRMLSLHASLVKKTQINNNTVKSISTPWNTVSPVSASRQGPDVSRIQRTESKLSRNHILCLANPRVSTIFINTEIDENEEKSTFTTHEKNAIAVYPAPI